MLILKFSNKFFETKDKFWRFSLSLVSRFCFLLNSNLLIYLNFFQIIYVIIDTKMPTFSVIAKALFAQILSLCIFKIKQCTFFHQFGRFSGQILIFENYFRLLYCFMDFKTWILPFFQDKNILQRHITIAEKQNLTSIFQSIRRSSLYANRLKMTKSFVYISRIFSIWHNYLLSCSISTLDSDGFFFDFSFVQYI